MASQPRQVESVVVPEETSDGAGVRIRRSIASRALDYLDPFLLFDHFGSDDPGEFVAGFPTHPHRGIETVTYMLAGVVDHRDSLGHAGSIGPGDVQWMTAGSGIMHEEMPQTRAGRLEGFQLWVNLPRAQKMTDPRYQEYAASEIPTVTREGGAAIRVVAGSVEGVRGPVAEIAAAPTYLDVALPPNDAFEHAIEPGHSAFAYVFEGEGAFGVTDDRDGRTVASPRLVVFGDGDSIRARAGASGVRFLLVSGRPLGEPVARYGPFVMNTQGEIKQALLDLERGTFIRSRS
jgi:redox-sensitive bicupin YhaK (pirin superfamily)